MYYYVIGKDFVEVHTALEVATASFMVWKNGGFEPSFITSKDLLLPVWDERIQDYFWE